jgi:hypothetical protein
MSLAEHFHKLDCASREQLLQYLADEYAGIDDEFTVIIDQLIQTLYSVLRLTSQEQIEKTLETHLFAGKSPAELYSVCVLLENVNVYIAEWISS